MIRIKECHYLHKLINNTIRQAAGLSAVERNGVQRLYLPFMAASVSHSVHRGLCVAKGGGICVKGVHVAKGDMHGKESCMQDRWPLKRTVRILLECILVTKLYHRKRGDIICNMTADEDLKRRVQVIKKEYLLRNNR